MYFFIYSITNIVLVFAFHNIKIKYVKISLNSTLFISKYFHLWKIRLCFVSNNTYLAMKVKFIEADKLISHYTIDINCKNKSVGTYIKLIATRLLSTIYFSKLKICIYTSSTIILHQLIIRKHFSFQYYNQLYIS